MNRGGGEGGLRPERPESALRKNEKALPIGKGPFLDLDLEYFPWENVGFGIGYNFLEIGYEETGGDPLDITYEYDGILLRALFEF